LTADEVAAYMQGYMDNEASGDFKDWGWLAAQKAL
jgi:hypothetical protein